MLFRTHFAFIVLIVLLFLPRITNQFIFIALALFVTFLPDIDIPFSKLGHIKFFRFLQIFVKHRGVLHSLTFCIIFSIILTFFWPVAVFGFFTGYAFHLIADSFTKEGIEPFWPYKKRARGFIKTGGYMESILFVFLILADILALILIYFI